MTSQKRRGSMTDTMLLSIWVLGYQVLIGMFALLQRIERSAGKPK